jgi:GT2 family glycosyltransferase
MPRLSVVIPTYDTASMTLHCCRAVLDSLPEPAEVIVADDGSTDGTAELLAREAPEVRVVRLETNSGFAAAANRGIAETSGGIILLLNSDAMVERDALRALVAAFDADARLGVAGAQLLNEDGTPQWSGGQTPTLPWMIGVVSGAGHLARLLRRRGGATQRQVDWVSGAAMAFRREVWDAAGPLNERYLFYSQDIELCLRARAAGWRVGIVGEARVRHGQGQTIAAGSALGYDPARLWPDLLTWGRGHYGSKWGRRARVVLVCTAAARIVVRIGMRRETTAMVLGVRRMWSAR